MKKGPKRVGAKLLKEVVDAPMEKIGLDIFGPLRQTPSGNQYILVVEDYFTNWVEAFPLENHKAQTVADCLVTEFIARYGVPMQIHTDQGTDFESRLFKEMCELLGIEKTKTSPYWPQSDGLVERTNRTLKTMLKTVVNAAKDDWDDHLPYLVMAYRSTIQESTGCTPNLLMLGRETNLPVDLMYGVPQSEEMPSCAVEYVEWVKEASKEAFEIARTNMQKAAIRQEKSYNRRRGKPEFAINDWVWRFIPAREKLAKEWHGPYLIIKKVGEVNYQIQLGPQAHPLVVHVDQLKKCEGETPENWLELPESAPEGTDLVQQLEDPVIQDEVEPEIPLRRSMRSCKPVDRMNLLI